MIYDNSRHVHLSMLILAMGLAAVLTPIVVLAFKDSFNFGMFTLGAYVALLPLLVMVLRCREKDADACVDMESKTGNEAE